MGTSIHRGNRERLHSDLGEKRGALHPALASRPQLLAQDLQHTHQVALSFLISTSEHLSHILNVVEPDSKSNLGVKPRRAVRTPGRARRAGVRG